MRLEVLPVPTTSENPPQFPVAFYQVQLMENCKIGEVLDVYQAEDADGDKLWYSLAGTDSLMVLSHGLNPTAEGDGQLDCIINKDQALVVTSKKVIVQGYTVYMFNAFSVYAQLKSLNAK